MRDLHRPTRILFLLIGFLGVTLLTGCGGSKETTTTGLPPTTIVTLGEQPQTTTTTEAPDRFPAKITAQALAVSTGSGGQMTGSAVDFSVYVDRRDDNKISVGVREGEVAGTGDMWRATAWTAPLVATQLLNLNLAGYTIDYEVSGRADGPSAGALMTIATVAALMGDRLDSTVTMTGTINPDYTIGPVGGIPQKLEGAANAGKTTVLVPLGERYDRDGVTGEMVDLVERGTELGLTVREVADIYEAYPYFTGKEIPRTQATASGTPAVNSTIESTLKECIQANAAEALNALEAFEGQSAEAQKTSQDYAQAAWDALDRVTKYMTQGSMGAAYGQSQWAVSYAAQAWLRGLAYDAEEWEQFASKMASITPSTDLDELAAELAATSPSTVGEASCVMDAWGALASAYSGAVDTAYALNEIESGYSEMAAEDVAGYLNMAIDSCVYSLLSKWCTEDDLKLAAVSGGPKIVSSEGVSQMAEAYRRAAEANMAMLESTVIPAKAQQWGVSEQDARIIMAGQDGYYYGARGALQQIRGQMSVLPEGTARDYAVLGTSFLAFTGSAASLALNYDYVAQYDENGAITDFRYDVPLSRALELARDNAENSIMLIENASEAAVVPWVWYEFANVYREGGPADKISALFYYWNAHAQARALLAMSGALPTLVED